MTGNRVVQKAGRYTNLSMKSH